MRQCAKFFDIYRRASIFSNHEVCYLLSALLAKGRRMSKFIEDNNNKPFLQTKPYDAKKSCWVPDDKDGFVEGEIRKSTGEQVTVAVGVKVSF